MKMKLLTIIIGIALVIFFSIYFISNFNIIDEVNQNCSNNPTNINNSTLLDATPIPALIVPSNKDVIGKINWSNYPNLQNGRVIQSYVAKPNNVIKHEFIHVQLDTDIVNTKNNTEIFNQLAGVAKEAREIYGINSGINIYGNVGGIGYYHVEILPYEEKMYFDG